MTHEHNRWCRRDDPLTTTPAMAMAEMLRTGTEPATELFTRLAGAEITAEITEARWHQLTSAEYWTLRAPLTRAAWRRRGILRAGDTLVAETEALLLPDRLPFIVRHRLGMPWPGRTEPPADPGAPVGAVLGALGAERVPLGAYVTPGHTDGMTAEPVTVISRGCLLLEGRRVVLATEFVLESFCQTAASLAGQNTVTQPCPSSSRERTRP